MQDGQSEWCFTMSGAGRHNANSMQIHNSTHTAFRATSSTIHAERSLAAQIKLVTTEHNLLMSERLGARMCQLK